MNLRLVFNSKFRVIRRGEYYASSGSEDFDFIVLWPASTNAVAAERVLTRSANGLKHSSNLSNDGFPSRFRTVFVVTTSLLF